MGAMIVSTPDTLFGATRIAGTRISVKLIRECILAGETVADLLVSYPHLTREQIEAANQYAIQQENRKTMNALMPTSKPDSFDLSPFDAKIAALDTMTVEELRAELSSALGLTATGLRYLAAVWNKLEKRGDDLSNLRTGIGVYLPAIAAGTVLPETVVGFAGQPLLLKAVADLPPEEQRRLVEGGTVAVVVRQGDGYTHRMLPVSGFDAKLTRQVFGNRMIRNESEQIARLTAAAKPPAWKPGKPVKRGKVTVDRGAGVVRIGRMDAEIADVVEALRQCGVIP